MPEGPRRKNLRQYVVYLNKTLDKDIIDHLEPLLDERRANEEVRRLLHAALHPPMQQPAARPVYRPEEYSSNEDTTVAMPVAASAKAKARQTFGGFED